MSLESHRREPQPVLGYTTRRHLLLDLDDTTLFKAKTLAFLIMNEWNKVGDCLVCRSSHTDYAITLSYYGDNTPFIKRKSNNYHLIFDNDIGYNLSVKICIVLASLNVLERDYVKIRRFRGDMTLRTSPAVLMTHAKPVPVPVYYVYNGLTEREDGRIFCYLRFLYGCRHFFGFESDTEIDTDYPTYHTYTRGQQDPIDALIDRYP